MLSAIIVFPARDSKMTAYFYTIVVLCATVSAAPPAHLQRYTQVAAARQVQTINPLDFYLDSPEAANYYNNYNQPQPIQQKQSNVEAASAPESAPARLETLEPDSEVELIPGAQQPQQPPQQNPVSPNIPGLVPGQRVFIVHMPVAGIRPGTIGGYQPIYIVAAGPQGDPGMMQGSPQYVTQGNTGYAGNAVYNGYQNAILLDPSGQTLISPIGYPRPGIGPQGNPGLSFGAPLVNRPFEFGYQVAQGQLGFRPIQKGFQGAGPQSVRLSQVAGFQQQQLGQNSPRNVGNDEQQSDPKRIGQSENESDESKEPESLTERSNRQSNLTRGSQPKTLKK